MAGQRSMVRARAGEIYSLYDGVLPLEVCQLISEHLSRSYSTAATLSSCSRSTKDVSVDLSLNVCAHFINHHGKAYLSSLSNKFDDELDDELDDKTPDVVTVLIHKSSSSQHAQASRHVYVAHDPWGIRRILFRQPTPVARTTNIWWETLTVGCSGQLTGKTDVCCRFLVRESCRQRMQSNRGQGLKIRQLLVDGEVTAKRRLLWQRPNPSPSKVIVLQRRQFPFQLSEIVINDQQTRGYWVGLLNGRVVVFRPEKATPTSCHHVPMPTPRFWLYLPINSGQWVRHILLRREKDKRNEAVLIVSQPQTLGRFN